MHVSCHCCGWSFGRGLASRFPFLPLGLDYEDSYFCWVEESWGLFPDLIPIPGWSSLALDCVTELLGAAHLCNSTCCSEKAFPLTSLLGHVSVASDRSGNCKVIA